MPQRPGAFPTGEPARGDEGSSIPPAQLIRLHRHSLTNVVVIGGTSARRAEVARSFHRESPLRGAAFVAVDAASDGEALSGALAAWTGEHEDPGHPYAGAEHGTLFVDQVERLSPESQRLLLALAKRLLGEPAQGREVACPGRIVVGNAVALAPAVGAGRFLATLYDALDKVRVELEVPPGERST